MVGELFAGLGAFNSMFSIAKSLKDMNDVAIRNDAVTKLWEQIFTAQTRYAAAMEEIGELEKKLSQCETWNAEKQRYILKDFGGETFAYALKPDAANNEPAHRICPTCYQKGQKSILQNQGGEHSGRQKMRCTECAKDFFSKTFGPQPHLRNSRPRRYPGNAR